MFRKALSGRFTLSTFKYLNKLYQVLWRIMVVLFSLLIKILGITSQNLTQSYAAALINTVSCRVSAGTRGPILGMGG